MSFQSTIIEEMTPEQLTAYVAMRTSDYLYQQSLYNEFRAIAGHARTLNALREGEQALPIDVDAMINNALTISHDQCHEIEDWLIKEAIVLERLMSILMGQG
jgi:hypothetical protein